MNLIQDIIEMHEQFELHADQVPHHLDADEKQFRYVAMMEEVNEYKDANTLADQLDALVDLQVFLLGTVYRQGMVNVFEEAFKRVMAANKQKTLATTASDSKRGFKRDLIKGPGWKAPSLEDLVGDKHE